MPDNNLAELEDDIRLFETNEEVSDHFLLFIDSDDASGMHYLLIETALIRILRDFSGAKKARKADQLVSSMRSNFLVKKTQFASPRHNRK